MRDRTFFNVELESAAYELYIRTNYTWEAFTPGERQVGWIAWMGAKKAFPTVMKYPEEPTYTVEGVVMSPLEYIDYLHSQLGVAK